MDFYRFYLVCRVGSTARSRVVSTPAKDNAERPMTPEEIIGQAISRLVGNDAGLTVCMHTFDRS